MNGLLSNIDYNTFYSLSDYFCKLRHLYCVIKEISEHCYIRSFILFQACFQKAK